MKKLFIFFIIMVSLCTFALTRTKKFDENKVVSEEELTEYRIALETHFNASGRNLSEEEINNHLENYRQTEISLAKSSSSGLEFGQALKISIIISVLSCAGLFIIITLTKSHYREFYGNPYASNTELYKEKLQRDFLENNKDLFQK